MSAIVLAGFGLGYLLGSIPFGLILTRLAGTTDLRSIGSGNIGATNVLRTGRKGLATTTLLLDMLKATAAVLIAAALWGQEAGHVASLAAAAGAFIGHLFPVWLKFKGGKGVAVYIGALLGLAWPFALVFCAIWLLVAWLTRYSSLSALVASLSMPVILWWARYDDLSLLFSVLTLLLWFMHRANIARLRAGTESRIGAKS